MSLYLKVEVGAGCSVNLAAQRMLDIAKSLRINVSTIFNGTSLDVYHSDPNYKRAILRWEAEREYTQSKKKRVSVWKWVIRNPNGSLYITEDYYREDRIGLECRPETIVGKVETSHKTIEVSE